MLKISYAGCLGLSPAISSQFSVKMCTASKKNSLFLLQITSVTDGQMDGCSDDGKDVRSILLSRVKT